MRRALALALAALVLGGCSQDQRPAAPRAELSAQSYGYQPASGLLSLSGVVNRTGRGMVVTFRAACLLQPLDPLEARFASQPVPVSESGGAGYWLEHAGGVDPLSVGGPMACSFTAHDGPERLRVETASPAVGVPLPEAGEGPEPGPRPPKGVPVSPRP